MQKSLVFLIFGAALMGSCKKNNPKVTPVCDGSSPTYNSFVKSIMTSNCVGCHSDMSTYAGLSNYLSNGKFKKEVLTNQTMPENGTLDASTLNRLQCWVDNGFPEN